MKRLTVVLAALLALAAPLAAAEGQGTDLFAGYSFAQIDDVNRHGGNRRSASTSSARSTASWTRAPTGAAREGRASTT